ncbi:MAG: hypothetical protein HQM05_13700 [Magnetococcales bacterium]|nr:hypothetical protein [Magnetococcales bacterium]
MKETIELSMAQGMAEAGLPGGEFPAWNLNHWDIYNRQWKEALGHGNRPIRHGGWVFDPDILVLRHQHTGYEVDLEQTTTAAQLLDWILQMAHRPEMAVQEMLVLLHAVADAKGIGSLQGAFCPYGQNMPPVSWGKM